MKISIPENILKEYTLQLPLIKENFLSTKSVDFNTRTSKLHDDMSLMISEHKTDGFLCKKILGFGEPHNILYHHYSNDDNHRPPKYLITDAGRFEKEKNQNIFSYMMCNIMLDENFMITDILVGGCSRPMSSHTDYCENLSSLLGRDFIKTEYGVYNLDDLVWVTDQTERNVEVFFQKEGIFMQHTSHFYENKDFASMFFIDGLCHSLLNNKDLRQSVFNPENREIKEQFVAPLDSDYFIQRNCVVERDYVPEISRYNNFNTLHLKDMACLNRRDADYNVFDKIEIGRDAIVTLRANKIYTKKIISTKAVLESNIRHLKSEQIQIFSMETPSGFLADNIECQTAFIGFSSFESIAKRSLKAKNIILSNCPNLVDISYKFHVEKLIVENCPKLDIKRLQELNPDMEIIEGIPKNYGGKAYSQAKNSYNQMTEGRNRFNLFPYSEMTKLISQHRTFFPMLLNRQPYKKEQDSYIQNLLSLCKSTGVNLYQRYLNVEGVDFSVKHMACHNENAGLPKYIISDGGFFNKGFQYYMGACVILDQNKDIHSVLIGGARTYEHIYKLHHEMFALEMGLDYLETEFEITDTSNLIWATDQDENNIAAYYDNNKLNLGSLSFPSSTEAFVSKILIDGFCHEALGNRGLSHKIFSEQYHLDYINNSSTRFGLSRDNFMKNMEAYPEKHIHDNFLITGDEILSGNNMLYVGKIATNTPGSFFSITGTKPIFLRHAEFEDLDINLCVPTLEGNNFIFDNVRTDDEFICEQIIAKKGIYIKNCKDLTHFANSSLKTRMMVIENCPNLQSLGDKVDVRILWIKGDIAMDLEEFAKNNPHCVVKRHLPDSMQTFSLKKYYPSI